MKALLIGLLASGVSMSTQSEVAQLLAAVENSGCQFNRNGSLYDGKSARAHLQKKYDYLVKKDLVTTADSFIERGASISSSSGKPYLIVCPGKAGVTSAAWLGAELRALRKK